MLVRASANNTGKPLPSQLKMLRKSLIAAAVALCSNGTGAAELKVTELGVVETLVDAFTVQKHCGVMPDFSA